MPKISTLYTIQREQQIKLIQTELKEAKKELKANHGTNKEIEIAIDKADFGDNDFSLGFDYGYMRGLEVALSLLQANEHKTK
jgi:hypothetical protein